LWEAGKPGTATSSGTGGGPGVDWAAERVQVFLAAEATARAVAVDPGAEEAESAAAADRAVVSAGGGLAVAEPEGSGRRNWRRDRHKQRTGQVAGGHSDVERRHDW